MASNQTTYIRFFDQIGRGDVKTVGGKNASLGEMVTALSKKGINVPYGFATTADAFRNFIEENGLKEKIAQAMKEWKTGKLSLEEAGKGVRKSILKAKFPASFSKAILDSYRSLKSPVVAVRSSATAEDLPKASFAGQLESYLNIKGEKALLGACKKCLASLFTDRAIVYREEQGFDQLQVALSIGVQEMVRADKGAAGVIFTLDTESGFPEVILINAIYGLGELIVKGVVDPDQYLVYKPLLKEKGLVPIVEKTMGLKQKKLICKGNKTARKACSIKERKSFALSDDEILEIAKWAKLIEDHYGMHMDIEWAKDGVSKKLFIVQARPETVHSQKAKIPTIETYTLRKKAKVLLKGLSVGRKIVAGKVCKLKSPGQIQKFTEGAILVTPVTDPDWVPIMKKAAGIVTDHGGRTSHAAIVSRELGVPAIVGTETGTHLLKDGQEITLSCAEGDIGFIFDGILDYEVKKVNLKDLPKTKTSLMLNIGDPATAMAWWKLPAKGVGLARMEFIISNHIQIHPLALVNFKTVNDSKAKKKIEKLTEGYRDKEEYFVDNLSLGIAKIAAALYPHPVIVRLSDFKTNEYAQLIGGAQFEPKEENPMLGWRGASRYYNPSYEEGFALECRAIKRAREKIGMTNIVVMVPFCRTLEEADSVLKTMAKYGLARGKLGLEVYVMCEIPSNAILGEEFANRFDGFSIGSNDLTQLVLGVDRDSDRISFLFNEQNDAVKTMIQDVIKKAHKKKCKVGICGQAPSDHPEFAQFLVKAGIDSISVIPDSFLIVHKNIVEAEKRINIKHYARI